MADFEQNLEQLEKQLETLKNFSATQGVDLSREIKSIDEKVIELKKEAYSALSAWDQVNLARHANRPTTLEYIERIFEDFMEFHGDRNFKDDTSIVGGIATLEGMPVTVIGHQKGRDTKENIKASECPIRRVIEKP